MGLALFTASSSLHSLVAQVSDAAHFHDPELSVH